MTETNPYQSPLTSSEPLPTGRRPTAAAWIVIALLAIPAFCFGFFVSCFGAFSVFGIGALSDSLVLFSSFAGGAVAVVLLVWGAVKLARRGEQRDPVS